MKYYNSELDSGKPADEKVLIDLLDDVRKSIYRSLNKLNDNNKTKRSIRGHSKIQYNTQNKD
jgi:hypothetical protein